MILAGVAAAILLAWAGGRNDGDERVQLAQARSGFTVQQQIIIRIPRRPATRGAPAAAPVRWRESRGPRCIDARHVVGAGHLGETSVDLVLRNASRVRVQLSRRCPALDFYRGFYVNTEGDGRICADRDTIRSRAGGECPIEQFRTLRPVAN